MSRSVEIDSKALALPARLGARLVARGLLERVRERREGLDAGSDNDALHDFRVALRRLRSWLRACRPLLEDTLARKHERRLGRVADATSESRDLEVHLDWLGERGKDSRQQDRIGITWLAGRLESRRAQADLDLRRVLAAELDRSLVATERAMGRYTVVVDQPELLFGDAAAAQVRSQSSELRSALGRVATIGDRVELHAARIAGKRLRYLLEPFTHTQRNVDGTITTLVALQDELGAIHDAQVFSSYITDAVAELRVAREESEGAGDPIPGLESLTRTLHRTAVRAFGRFQRAWLDDAGAAEFGKVERIASELSRKARMR